MDTDKIIQDLNRRFAAPVSYTHLTPLYEQAAKWCGKFKRRGKDGIISRYEYCLLYTSRCV